MSEDSDHDRLVKIETKLDIFLYDHEKRLRKIERWMWAVAGAAGAGGGVLADLFTR